MGFGFSDSYHALENRLDALYRHKVEMGIHLKLFAIIPLLVLLICALSYVFRADLIIINDAYNSAFEVTVFDAVVGDFVPVPSEECAGLFELKDGLVLYDSSVLYALYEQYTDNRHIDRWVHYYQCQIE